MNVKNIEFEAGYIILTDDYDRRSKYPISSFMAGGIGTADLEDNAVTKAKMGWTLNKLLKGAGLSSTPTEIDPYADADAKAASVQAGAITDGVTKAPTHDAVYDVKTTADAAQPASTDAAAAVTAMGDKGDANPLNHDRYADADAVTAMGVKGDANPLNHDRYTHPNHSGEVTSVADGAQTIANKITMTATSPITVSGSPTVIAGGAVAIAIPAATNAIPGHATAAHITAIEANTEKVTNATHTGEVTGSGALTIANDAVTAAKIAALDEALTFSNATLPANTVTYIGRDNTGDLTLHTITGKAINLAIVGADVLRVEGAKISLLQDIFTDRWQSSDTNVYIGGDVCGGDGATATALLNVIIGYQAANAITSGHENVIIGAQAGYTLDECYESVIIGYLAGYSGTGTFYRNVIMGYKALEDATTARENVIIGWSAAMNGTTALGNVIIGNYIAVDLTTGTNNVCVGIRAGNGDYPLVAQDSCIFIGNRCYAAGTPTDGHIQISGLAGTYSHLLSDNSGDWEIMALTGKKIDLRIGSTDMATVNANGLLLPVSVDSAAVADEVTLGAYEISAGHRALALSQEDPVLTEGLDAADRSLPVRINGATYKIMLVAV